MAVRLQDIALVIARAIAVCWLIAAGVELAGACLRFVVMMLGGAYQSHWLTLVEVSTFLEPMKMAAVGLIILAASKAVARFAAKPFEHDVFA
jgi:hypothetical protein